MERKNIIKKFLDKGYQLDAKALDFFCQNRDRIDYFLERIKNELKEKIITFNYIQSLLKNERFIDIKILKGLKEEKKKYIIEDYIKFFNLRYKKLRKILSTRLDLINPLSINRISQKSRKFSIIGMVKEKNRGERSLLLEDLTGEITVYMEEKIFNRFEEILQDEVIGVLCEKKDNVIKVKKIIYPDIPLRREINKTKDNIQYLFISDFHMDNNLFNQRAYENFLDFIYKEKNKLCVFILGDISSKKEDIISFFQDLPKNIFKVYQPGEIDPSLDVGDLKITNPSLVKVEDKIIVFSYHGNLLSEYSKIWSNISPEAILMNLLKKRNINPIFNLDNKIYDEDVFLLDIVPDILVTGHLHKPGILNYKGTTIISNGSFITQPIFWMVNLKTRESLKIDFT
jgi:DNA polymerase II small subunit/DNA polymerase delta subunit B